MQVGENNVNTPQAIWLGKGIYCFKRKLTIVRRTHLYQGNIRINISLWVTPDLNVTSIL